MSIDVDVEDVGVDLERRIAQACVVSSEFLSGARNAVKLDMVDAPYCRAVIEWSMEYFDKHGTPPGRNIIDIAEIRKGSLDGEGESLLLQFLGTLERDFKANPHLNAGYLLEAARTRSRQRTIEHAANEALAYSKRGDYDAAAAALDSFRSIGPCSKPMVRPYSDPSVLVRAFDKERREPLIKFPYAMGKMMNRHCVRGGFVVFQAPEKKGKSHILWNVAKQALGYGRRVALFGVGDMSEEQTVERIAISHCGYGMDEESCEEQIDTIFDCEHCQDNSCVDVHCPQKGGLIGGVIKDVLKINPEQILKDNPDYKPCSYCRGEHGRDSRFRPTFYFQRTPKLPILSSDRKARAEMWKFINVSQGDLRMHCAPSGTFSIKDLRAKLKEEEASDGFVPDVVVIDYMDILASSDKKQDFRHQQNDIWKDARALALEYNILVVSATQSNAAAYDIETQTMDNYSEDKRKLGHVTLFVGLNQTPDEYRANLMRLGVILQREGKNSGRQVALIQQIRRGRAHVGSFWANYNFTKKKKEERPGFQRRR